MSDLHWTGAALLLALAVLGPGVSGTRRDTIVEWEEFAREHGVRVDEPIVMPPPIERRRQHATQPRERRPSARHAGRARTKTPLKISA